ncbi:MAG TPA: DUF1194 domain-containing protein [Xanthobacteraceae bacterium]|nr:DUF1194 domain-containing protein [Xanthobacteraceae bacterium]
MRRISLVATLIAACAALAFGYASFAAPGVRPLPADLPGRAGPGSVQVDVELVLAVDISYSMDLDELALQREGYMQALTSPEFLHALKGGMHGRVALTYVEWAGITEQRVIMPWRLLDSEDSAAAVAAEIGRAPHRRAFRTSISGALQFSLPLFERNGYNGIRKVIDVSGDGTNNQGPLVTDTRDDVIAKGITINGLPLMLKRVNPATMDIPNLDIYYEDCVIGGPGAFVVPVRAREKFIEAIRTKLVLEIAGRVPEARPVPAQAKSPRISCTIGERMWQERWGGSGIDMR